MDTHQDNTKERLLCTRMVYRPSKCRHSTRANSISNNTAIPSECLRDPTSTCSRHICRSMGEIRCLQGSRLMVTKNGLARSTPKMILRV